MAQRRKLQVFVSSTFTDLKSERQAAVEAILKAGHIPAGMELFTAGDKSQMKVIEDWIDDSDVYLLLLGARYGSIEPESGLSYTHLEYEYAVKNGKALFAVVMSEKRIREKSMQEGPEVLERENFPKYQSFKNLVKSKLVEEWDDLKDIKYAVQSTLLDFDKRQELVGWVPGNEVANTGAIAEEIARLTKENAELRLQMSNSSKDQTKYSGLTFDEMYLLLNQDEIDISVYKPTYKDCLTSVATAFGDSKVGILHILWVWMNIESYGILDPYSFEELAFVLERLKDSRLVESVDPTSAYTDRCRITSIGKEFFLKLKLTRNTILAYDAVKELKEMDSYAAESQFVPYET